MLWSNYSLLCSIYTLLWSLYSFLWSIHTLLWSVNSLLWSNYFLLWSVYSLLWSIYILLWSVYSLLWSIHKMSVRVEMIFIYTKVCATIPFDIYELLILSPEIASGFSLIVWQTHKYFTIIVLSPVTTFCESQIKIRIAK